jgi:hypothetical protein
MDKITKREICEIALWSQIFILMFIFDIFVKIIHTNTGEVPLLGDFF